MSALALILAVALAPSARAQSRQNLDEYVAAALSADKAYSDAERDATLAAIKDRFADYGFDVVHDGDPGPKVVMRMLVEGSFDEAPPERMADVAFAAYQAVKRGAPADVVEGIALYGYQKKIAGDRLATWANGYEQAVSGGVPPAVAADLVHNAMARDWDDETFNLLKWGLVQAAKDGFDVHDYAVYLFGSMQKPGTRPGALTASAHDYFAKLQRTKQKPELPPYEGVFSKPEPKKADETEVTPELEARARKLAQAMQPKSVIDKPEVQAHPRKSPPPKPKQIDEPVPEREVSSDSIDKLWPGLDKSAMSYLGTPYVWGGTTHKGIDCSALTQNSYAENEVKIPRVSRDQWKTGASIAQPQLRRGDLIFFNTMGVGVSHVGMIVDPRKGPTFIHASSSHGVMLQDLSKRYYQARYLGARRVVP